MALRREVEIEQPSRPLNGFSHPAAKEAVRLGENFLGFSSLLMNDVLGRRRAQLRLVEPLKDLASVPEVTPESLLGEIAEERKNKKDQYESLNQLVNDRNDIIEKHKLRIQSSATVRKAVLIKNPDFKITRTGRERKNESVIERKIDREINKIIRTAIKGEKVSVKLPKYVQKSIDRIAREQQERRSLVRRRGARSREIKELDKWANYIENPEPISSNLRQFKERGKEYKSTLGRIQSHSDKLDRFPQVDEEKKPKFQVEIEDAVFLQQLRRAGLEFDLTRLGQAIPAELLGARARSQLLWNLLKFAKDRGDIGSSEFADLRKFSTQKIKRQDTQGQYMRWSTALSLVAGTSMGVALDSMPSINIANIDISPTPYVRIMPVPSSTLRVEVVAEKTKTPTPKATVTESIRATFTALRTAVSTPLRGTPTPTAVQRFAESMKILTQTVKPNESTVTVTNIPTKIASIAPASSEAEYRVPTITTQPRSESTHTPTRFVPTETATPTSTKTAMPPTATETKEPTATPTNSPTRTPTSVPPSPTMTEVPTKIPDTPTAIPTVIIKSSPTAVPSPQVEKPVQEGKDAEQAGGLKTYKKQSTALWAPVEVETFDVRRISVSAEHVKKELEFGRSPFVYHYKDVFEAGVEFNVDPTVILAAWRMENGYTDNSYPHNPGSIVYVHDDWIPGMMAGRWAFNRRWATFPSMKDGIRGIAALIAKDYYKRGQTDLWSIHSGIEGSGGEHAYHGWADAKKDVQFYLGFYSSWLEIAKRTAARKI